MEKYNLYLLVPDINGWDGVKTFAKHFGHVMGNEEFNIRMIAVKDCIDTSFGHRFKDMIPNGERSIIFINFWPASIIASSIKRFLPLCKIVQIIHDLPWLTVFNGDSACFLSSLASDFKNIKDEKLRKFLRCSTVDAFNTFNIVDRIVCLCRDTLEMLNSCYGVPIRKVSLICNAVPDLSGCDHYSGLLEVANCNRATVRLLFIGRPTLSKGWDKIIDVAGEIRESGADCKITCAGSTRFRAHIPDTLNMVFDDVGILDHMDVLGLIKSCDAILIPSRHEQCSYVGMESLMMGKEIFVCGGFGIVNMFNNTNSHKLGSFKDLEKSLSIKKGDRARTDYLNYYVPEIFKESYIQLILSMSD